MTKKIATTITKKIATTMTKKIATTITKKIETKTRPSSVAAKRNISNTTKTKLTVFVKRKNTTTRIGKVSASSANLQTNGLITNAIHVRLQDIGMIRKSVFAKLHLSGTKKRSNAYALKKNTDSIKMENVFAVSPLLRLKANAVVKELRF